MQTVSVLICASHKVYTNTCTSIHMYVCAFASVGMYVQVNHWGMCECLSLWPDHCQLDVQLLFEFEIHLSGIPMSLIFHSVILFMRVIVCWFSFPHPYMSLNIHQSA